MQAMGSWDNASAIWWIVVVVFFGCAILALLAIRLWPLINKKKTDLIIKEFEDRDGPGGNKKPTAPPSGKKE